MIWIAIIIGIFSLIALIFKNPKSRMGGTLGIFLSFVLSIISCIRTIEAGKVGIPILFGSVQNHKIDPGMHFVNPFISIKQMSVRTENYWMSASHDEGQKKGDDSIAAISSNGLEMAMDISVPYRLVPDAAPWVYQNLGADYVEKLLRPAIRAPTRRSAAKFSAEECFSTKRDQLAEKIQAFTEEEIDKLLETYDKKDKILIFSQVLVGKVNLPITVKDAIEQKLKNDQEQQAMSFRIMKEQKESERKKIEAEGIQKFQEIVSKGIDEKLLRWKAIDATLHLAESKNAKIVIIGSGKDGLPIILGNMQEK